MNARLLLCALLLAAALLPAHPAAGAPAAAAPAAAGAALPRGTERIASVEGVTEYRLANGLKVLLIPDPSIDTVTVNITYLVGSRHEGYGETGMAHLLEHLLFRGTPRFPNIKRDFIAARATTAPRRSTAPITTRPSRRARRTSTGRSSSKPTA
jgi:zinc protease